MWAVLTDVTAAPLSELNAEVLLALGGILTTIVGAITMSISGISKMRSGSMAEKRRVNADIALQRDDAYAQARAQQQRADQYQQRADGESSARAKAERNVNRWANLVATNRRIAIDEHGVPPGALKTKPDDLEP